MTDTILPLSDGFETPDESQWLQGVEKALKGGGIERITRHRLGGLTIHPLYRESNWQSAEGRSAPMPLDAPDAFLPWDIRQSFTHPDPATTNAEIMRDLERGVSSIEIKLDCTGRTGVSITDAETLATALNGVRADIAAIALDHGAGTGTSLAGLLAMWGQAQDNPVAQKFAFNIDPLGTLARTGLIEGGLDAAFTRCAALTGVLSLSFPASTALRIDARMVHEAGGSEAQELAALIASGVDTLRRLDAAGLSPELAAEQMVFALSVGANYGVEIAKLRAARRLWARCLDAMSIEAGPMRLQAVTSARQLTRYDAWTNMLRGTSACFAAAIGGADIITVRPFNEPLGTPEELGRRTARNTQIIAMEESQLGRIADPSGGAWFTESVGHDLAKAAWAEFQQIEREGGYGASLMADAFQARVADVRTARRKAIAIRKIPITGVSEFPQLDGITPPVADIDFYDGSDGVSDEGLKAFLPDLVRTPGEDSEAEPFWPIRDAEAYERLRDHAEAKFERSGKRPSIFIAAIGPLAEHTARADFARNLFAAGGIAAKEPPVPATSMSELAAAYRASGCHLAVICGADARYEDEAAAAATALKDAGCQRVYLAGKTEADGVDSHIFMGCDVVATLELAHAELGLT